MSTLSQANAALYRDWQRSRAAGGYKPLPRHEYALIALQDHAGGRSLAVLGRADVLDWVGSMTDVAPSTRKSYYSSARAFYNWAASEDEGVIDRSPMHGMKEPKTPDRPTVIPDKEVIAELIATTEKDRSPMGRRDTALIRVLADTGGPRASECAGLLIAGRKHPADLPAGLGVDLARDCITAIGKGSLIRTWPISAKTGTAVARWLRVRDGLPLADKHPRLWATFRSQHRPLTYSGVEDIIDRRCTAARLPHIYPHQIRHFSYHQFLLAGGRENDAMILYGWNDEQMPRHYAKALAAARALQSGNALAIGDQW